MGRTIRLRSVDTNPIFLPSRFWATDRIGIRADEGARFAKYATVVTELYSVHLEAGPPLPAKTSWARFAPTNLRGPRRFSGIAMAQDLGLGEVHQVPYDPDILGLADEQRRFAILDWLQDNLLALAASLGWLTDPLDIAYEACRHDGCRFQRATQPRSSRNRRYRAHIEYEIDGNGDAWSWATITSTDGRRIVSSDRHDSYPGYRSLRRASQSLRWQDDGVTWTPWTYPVVPVGRDELAETAHLAIPPTAGDG
jgi:hypothetical protein